MLRKLLMGSKGLKKFFIIPQITTTGTYDYRISSDIYPKNNDYLSIVSSRGHIASTDPKDGTFMDYIYTGSAMEMVVIKRLDSGKVLELSTASSDGGVIVGIQKVASESELYLQKSDVGKTIEITIEPAGGGLNQILQALRNLFTWRVAKC